MHSLGQDRFRLLSVAGLGMDPDILRWYGDHVALALWPSCGAGIRI